jgi:hypothetical protein
MEILIVGIAIISVMTNLAVGAIGIYAWIELKSFMKSTHKIEYIPFEPVIDKNGKEKPVKESDPLKEYGII